MAERRLVYKLPRSKTFHFKDFFQHKISDGWKYFAGLKL
jgi:hypothetical protein